MNKFCLIVPAALLVCGCTADLKSRIDSLEQRVEALESKVNSNAEGISALVAAAEKAVTVTSVERTENGYIIHFSDNTVAEITHGTNGADGSDGADGKDGVTPVIGVAEEDGVYYWTVNGEFLLNNGEKVPVSGKDGSDGSDGADGKDGVTPQFKIEDGIWYVSADGATWEPVPVSGSAASRELTIEETENEYVFTLGETVIKIAKEKAFSIIVDTTNLEAQIGESSVRLHYTLTGGDDSTVILAESDDLDVAVDTETCNLDITVPSGISEGHIFLRAIRNSDSRYAAQYITLSVNYYGTFGGAILVSDTDYLEW